MRLPMTRGGTWLRVPALFFLAAAVIIPVGLRSDSEVQVRYPDPDIGIDSLPARAIAQEQTANQFKVFYQFHFTDKIKESGITFVHHTVDDASVDYKLVHYDHGSGIAVADVDNDGLYDIYFVNQAGGNELWKNLGGGKFKNITDEAGVGLPGRISVGASFADIDNAGTEDLFVTTVLGGNALFKNDGHGHFRDITKEAGLDLVAHSSGAVFFDYNHDGLLDLLVCNVGKYTGEEKGAQGQYVGLVDAFSGHLHPDRFEYPVLYENLGNDRFKDWFEIDCSQQGLTELNQKVCTGQSGKISVLSPRSSRSSVIFDLDNDGDLDIVTNDFNSAPQVLVSDLAQQKKIHWLKVVLVGTHSNRDGLGATVRVHAAEQTYTKYNDGKSGYLSQSALPLYFGLGDTTKISRVEVDWPSGRKQVVTRGLRENQVLRIVEPK